MSREFASVALLVVAAGVAGSSLGLTGCNLVLGLGDLKDRPVDAAATDDVSEPADSGPDGTAAREAAAEADTGDATQMDGAESSTNDAMSPDAGQSCVIGGMTTAAGGANPVNACLTCQPSSNATAWSNASDVTSCGGSGTCSSGSCVPAPSCSVSGTGLTNCGATSDSCCTSLEVPGGTYFRTYEGVGGTADPATLTGFRLDKYEITVGRFRRFVNAWNGGAGWTPTASSGKHAHLNGGKGLADSGSPGAFETGWLVTDSGQIAPTNANLACDATYATWTATAGNNENLPINCVTWYEAYAFCIYDGGFLPSEAEWEYAYAAGSQQLPYPWGSTDPGTGNHYAIFGCLYPSDSRNCGATNIAPVGTPTSGVGAWGQLDLAGNVWEMNLDWRNTAYVDPCTDCANLTVGSSTVRIARGGDYSNSPMFTFRNGAIPTSRSSIIGARCARTP
jgi:formylglycine-generating enzyme